ncbi:aminotransferase class I/II-fold pyridoxal phosphate-dependent enzyme [Arthrobacter agilis]|uniref:histidinol-phosphate transaminase n=1 Tax=Arthrobacter agilis TaxID=37921 RepID=UPI000B356A98|nr:histidinol-phosphate transaminase [Arthrobacter agilis]OUM42446.1 aminotransferase [Arthrobacter agilis]PPB45787.1 histidinol-phosphate transaminase [Arthrobacter agilis]TPV26514.1 aminotransferase class I/II-fold pyridoxal phosphate-dependent enzyme [Arthrobacter agilis]VDR33574.1 Putative phenylalanine aminotransferase [Arthrobacter agilis]
MTSIDDLSAGASVRARTDLPADPSGAPATTDEGLRPRGVFGKLPRYAAGKPPVVVEGLESFKLSSNENPLPPLPAVLEAIASETSINRYPDPMTTALRTELAGYLGVPATDIVTGAGSLGALNQILATFAGQNDFGAPDEVVYAWRSFEAYPISVGLAGAAGVQVPVRADGTHDLDAMAAAITERTRVVMLCTPNNPTGPILTHSEVLEFLAKVPTDVVVVIDEAYQEFVRRPDAVNGIGLYRDFENVIVLRTFSKAHGLAGLRVGYSVSQQTLTQHLRVGAVPFAVSQVAEHAAVTSLRHVGEVEARVQSIVDERTRVVAGLRALGWTIPEAEGNFVWLALGEHTQDFAARAAEHALSVRAFGSEGVRVSIGEEEANSRFLALCGEYTHRPAAR